MTFDRSRPPDPSHFFESEDLRLACPKSSKWRTAHLDWRTADIRKLLGVPA